MFVPHMPSRPADIYTVRIAEHEAQTRLALSLRRLVIAAGGTFMITLIGGPGFIFRMPTAAPCPIDSYLHGGLLEEGCIHVTKMTLGKVQERNTMVEEYPSDAESVEDEDDDADHPGLKMQWNWTELKKDGRK